MKHTLSFAILALASTALASAAVNPAGHFARTHDVAMHYSGKAACEADQGRWDGDEDGGFCIFTGAEDSVDVKAGEKGLSVAIDTITTNGHTCSFESDSAVQSGNKIVAQAKSEAGIDDGDCEVTVTYLDENTVSVDENGKCKSFCGARATLFINQAIRK